MPWLVVPSPIEFLCLIVYLTAIDWLHWLLMSVLGYVSQVECSSWFGSKIQLKSGGKLGSKNEEKRESNKTNN